MSPIKGLSEQRRISRIGKIHLGVKKTNVKGVEYPSATEYFVVPEEVERVYGKTPKELPIMIPTEDDEYWASQYYRNYSRSRGLVCRGDGETCRRMVDAETGALANRDSKEVSWNEMTCSGRECELYQSKRCREVMNLQFLLPEVPGLGVWQIDTSSINSIRNINSAAELIRGICGHIKMIPLLLTLEKQEVVNPDDGKKKSVSCLNIRHGQSLHSLLNDSVKPTHELLTPAPDEEAPPLDTGGQEEEVKDIPFADEQAEQAEKDSVEFFPPEEKDTKSDAKPTPQLTESIINGINMDWLDEQIRLLQKGGIKAYSDKTILSYLNAISRSKATTREEVLGNLSKEQAIEFATKVQADVELL